MPINLNHYPPNWKAFSFQIRFGRAQGRCACTGQCGMHTPNPKPRRCVERHGQPAQWARGNITLTVAHLCNCDPPCAIAAHVRAMCQRCHLLHDQQLHLLHRHQKSRIQKPHLLTKHTTPNIIHTRAPRATT